MFSHRLVVVRFGGTGLRFQTVRFLPEIWRAQTLACATTMSEFELTKGAILSLHQESESRRDTLVLQVLDVTEIKGTGRYRHGSACFPDGVESHFACVRGLLRLTVSDGVHSQPAMLASPLTPLVTSSQLKVFSVVAVKEFIVLTMQCRRFVVPWALSHNRVAGC